MPRLCMYVSKYTYIRSWDKSVQKRVKPHCDVCMYAPGSFLSRLKFYKTFGLHPCMDVYMYVCMHLVASSPDSNFTKHWPFIQPSLAFGNATPLLSI